MTTSRGSQLIFGIALFFLGCMTWLVLGSVLVLLIQDAEWPKYLAVIGFAMPLSAVAWREHMQGRTRGVGYLVAGWLLAGTVVGGTLYLVLTAIGPLPRG